MAAPPIAVHAAKQGKLRACLLGILLDGPKLKFKVDQLPKYRFFWVMVCCAGPHKPSLYGPSAAWPRA